jgi:signal transduction histidine kinase
MKKSLQIVDLFISERIKNNPFLLRKARIVVFIILFLLLLVFILLGLCLILKFDDVFILWPGIVCAFLLLFILKKTANLRLIGNLFALFWILMLATSVPQTGGLHSDNLLWLIIAPLISLLFSNKKWGFTWLVALIVFTIGLYFYGDTSNQIIKLDKSYYLISYIFLFITIFCTVLIFEHGQTLIIKMLESQKQELQSQKQTLEEQKLILEQKNQEILAQKVQLEKMGEKLKETNFALEHFAATASHDLKEPLRMISMYTTLAQRRMNSPDERRDEYMGFVTNGVSRMEKLLTNLLQFARTGRNTEDIKEVDLNSILYNVIQNLAVTLKDTGANVLTTFLPTITASETEMSQLFQNLISNAIKFRKDGVTPEVFISYQERKDNHIISIKDNGIGIRKEYQAKVFAIFERLNAKDKYEGSGIGLATCRRIVTNCNGKIWLRSEEGVGTTFYIAIPKSEVNLVIQEDELSYA